MEEILNTFPICIIPIKRKKNYTSSIPQTPQYYSRTRDDEPKPKIQSPPPSRFEQTEIHFHRKIITDLSLPLSLSFDPISIEAIAERADRPRCSQAAPRSAWICMRIPSCLQRLSGNRSADREGEGCTGDTDIFLTSKGTYGRFFDAASMQTSSVLHHDGSLVETKGRGGGGKEGGRGFTQLRHESTFKEREFRLKPRCNTRVPSALYGPRSPGSRAESVSRNRSDGEETPSGEKWGRALDKKT